MNVQNHHSDSDESWIILNEDEQRARKEIEELKSHETDESEVCVLTDPEEKVQVSSAENQSTDNEVNVKPETDGSAVKQNKDVAQVELKPIVWTNSVTSACFIIAGLLIALYFQNYDDVANDKSTSQNVQYDQLCRPIGADIEYLPPIHSYNREKREYERDNLSFKTKHQKNSKFLERMDRDHRKMKDYERTYNKREMKQQKQKGDFKQKKEKPFFDHKNTEKYESTENEAKANEDKHKSKQKYLENYLNKKQSYLKRKEDKLSQKEIKQYAKQNKRFAKKNKLNDTMEDSSWDWLNKIHENRSNKRKQGKQNDWVFERAQGRNKKRDKAHWYFDYMDDRESAKYKKL